MVKKLPKFVTYQRLKQLILDAKNGGCSPADIINVIEGNGMMVDDNIKALLEKELN